MAFPASALMLQSWKYWLFVLGFALGAYSAGLTKCALVMSAVMGFTQQALQTYFLFLQAGILAGVLAGATRRRRGG